MAAAQNLPQGNAEENPCLDLSRVLSKRLEALNSMGNLLKIHLWMKRNFLWVEINFWVLLSIGCIKFFEKLPMKVSPFKVTLQCWWLRISSIPLFVIHVIHFTLDFLITVYRYFGDDKCILSEWNVDSTSWM